MGKGNVSSGVNNDQLVLTASQRWPLGVAMIRPEKISHHGEKRAFSLCRRRC